MKVCFFLSGFTKSGGIETSTSILVNKLTRMEKIDVFTLSYANTGRELCYTLDASITQDHLFDAPLSMKKAVFKNAVGRLTSYLKKNEIDILIACGSLYFPISVRACRRAKIKCVTWDHTAPTVTTDHAFQGFSRKYGAKRSDANALITKAAKAYYDENFRDPSKNFVFYNPLDEKALELAREYNTDSKKIIAVGRLAYPKNFPAMIRIAKRVLQNHPDWSWDVYGDGELREELEGQIEAAGLCGRFVLRGRVNDIYERYRDYSFIVMTSHYEGFPMTLLEAAANALPMVSYDIQTGPNEIIKDGENGLLVPAGDEDAACEAIEKLISCKELRVKMSAFSKENVMNFSLSSIAASWVELFCNLLK